MVKPLGPFVGVGKGCMGVVLTRVSMLGELKWTGAHYGFPTGGRGL